MYKVWGVAGSGGATHRRVTTRPQPQPCLPSPVIVMFIILI